MYFVDRSVAVIKPKAKFLEWLESLPEEGEGVDLTLDQLRSDCTVLLIPEYEEPEEAVAYIDEIFEQIFKMELASWHEDEASWPKDMSLKAFWETFDIEIHAMLIDTVDEELVNSLALSDG